MHRIIIPIFLVLTFLCSCSGKSETAVDWVNKANALWNGKEFNEPQKAIEYLNKAIKLQPNNSETYNMRGNIYFNLGQNQFALDDFSKAIHLNPNNADTYNNRGSVYDKLGQYQHEIEDFNDAIRLNPNDALFYNNRASAYLHQGNKILGCLDLQKACAMKFCNALEWAKREGYCR